MISIKLFFTDYHSIFIWSSINHFHSIFILFERHNLLTNISSVFFSSSIEHYIYIYSLVCASITININTRINFIRISKYILFSPRFFSHTYIYIYLLCLFCLVFVVSNKIIVVIVVIFLILLILLFESQRFFSFFCW